MYSTALDVLFCIANQGMGHILERMPHRNADVSTAIMDLYDIIREDRLQ
jgi:hypothetical protein